VNIFGNITNKQLKKIKLNFKHPFEVFKSIYQNTESSFLLESMENDNGLSRYSLIGFQPNYMIKAYGNHLQISDGEEVQEIETKNPFDIIKDLTRQGKRKGFQGALVGYVSYEAVRHFERLFLKKSEEPDFQFGLYTDCLRFDLIKKQCEYLTIGEDRSEDLRSIKPETLEVEPLKIKNIGTFYNKRQFCRMVEDAQERIKAGEIFQSVISNATDYKITGNKLFFYEKLREINPSPYMYHIKFDNKEIIGSSPEMLVRVENKNIETFPIAGTRPRGKNDLEDQKLAKELLKDEKEQAEHLMLVDLARNDIGRVSQIGTVTLPEYMNVKKFSHVQHIVTKVQGKLAREKDAVDSFSSIFPAGTVSGAPKIRAMEIIDQIEKHPRGPYAGAVGYFGLNGNADFAITIRTMICDQNHARIQAGAGIVHDSIPDIEYEECHNKAKALTSAMEMVQ
jgi:anthranilate synthase component 1